MKKILLLSILFAFASCSSLGVEVKAQANYFLWSLYYIKQ